MSVVKSEISDGVCVITLNRPEKMNAYNLELHHALYVAIDKADNDNSVRVMVVTGAGRAFCAGADISEGFTALSGGEFLDGVRRDYGGMLNIRTYECNTPIIAAVNGAAVGIGATMLLPMDIKIASSKSKFAFPFGRRGIVFDGAASFFLPRIVGMSKAQEWILKADIIPADEALKAGLISEVVEPDQVLDRAMDLARDIAQNVSPTSAAKNKKLMRDAWLGRNGYEGGPMGAHMAESELLSEAFVSYDCAEGVKAFFEKRAPKFKDRDE